MWHDLFLRFIKQMANSQKSRMIQPVSTDTYSNRLQRSKYLNVKCVIGVLIVHIDGRVSGQLELSIVLFCPTPQTCSA